MNDVTAPAADSAPLSHSEGISAIRALRTPAAEAPTAAAAASAEAPAGAADADAGDIDPQHLPAEALNSDAAADDNNSDPEPTGDDETGPQGATGDEDEDKGEPELPAIAAPQSWDEPSKAAFAKAPRDVQQTILARETQRDTAVSQALETAKEATKQATAQVEALKKVAADVDAILPKLKTQFADEFANVDWEAEAEEDPEATAAKWIRYQAQLQRLNTLDATKAEAAKAEETAFITEQRALMAEHAPLLIHKEHGPRLAQDLTAYLLKSGETPESVRLIRASHAGMALKAMLYDKAIETAQKAATAPGTPAPTPAPTETPAPARRVVPPSGGRQQVSSRQTKVQAADQRLSEEGSISAGLALLRARRGRNLKGR